MRVDQRYINSEGIVNHCGEKMEFVGFFSHFKCKICGFCIPAIPEIIEFHSPKDINLTKNVRFGA